MYNEEKNTQTTLFGDEVKAIEQEVTICVEREYDRTKDEYEQHYIRAIKNRHEGYGHAAEGLTRLELSMKRIKDDMKNYLGKLAEPNDSIVKDVAGDIYGHASQLAADAIAMAATAKRIIYDIMVEAGNEEYPIEALINSTDDDDFEENTETAGDIEYADADAQ